MTEIDKLKIASGIVEGVLALPIIGWMVYCFSFGLFPIAEVVLGIIGVVKSEKKVGSILQIIAGVIGWIPFIGWVMHIVTAVFLFKEGLNK